MKDKIKTTVLCFLFSEDKKKLLMIHKKRGQGAGKMNVPGGKVKAEETLADAVVRETQEETGLIPVAAEQVGTLEFYFPESNSWDNICHVFTAHKHHGTLLSESEECANSWINVNAIPYDKMWDSDRIWAPLLFAGKPFHRAYVFDANDKVKEERNLD